MYSVERTPIEGVLILCPRVFSDDRGFFMESFNQHHFNAITKTSHRFVQDNHSFSVQSVLRGLHFQRAPKAQGKLVRVIKGEVWDVAVDMRASSPTFGKWTGAILSSANRRQLWIPPGFAHGFVTLSETADFAYKTTEYYSPEHELCIRWDDATLGIQWPESNTAPIVSLKDGQGISWLEAISCPV